jgi:hypothetical protein
MNLWEAGVLSFSLFCGGAEALGDRGGLASF